MKDWKEIVQALALEPMPGACGYFRQTYRSTGIARAESIPQHDGDRPYGTAIYYLVTPDDFTPLHRTIQDELFHFYLGDAVDFIHFDSAGHVTRAVLGIDFIKGQRPQALSPGGGWHGTRLAEGGRWALLGATVVPGFSPADFLPETRESMLARFPQHANLIRRFTKGNA